MTAFDHWTAMHAWWIARRTEREAIGRAWAPRAAPQMTDVGVAQLTDDVKVAPNRDAGGETPSAGDLPSAPDPTRRRELLARYQALDAAGKKAFKQLRINGDDLDRIELELDKLAGEGPATQAASPGAPPPPTTLEQAQQRMADDKKRKRKAPQDKAPQDKPEALEDAAATVRARYTLLGDTGKAWLKRLVEEGDTSPNPWRLTTVTARNVDVYRGVISLAGWFTTPDDDLVRSIASHITGTYHPDTPAGVIIGQLNKDQAAEFAQIAADLTVDKYTPIPDPTTGGYRLEPVARG